MCIRDSLQHAGVLAARALAGAPRRSLGSRYRVQHPLLRRGLLRVCHEALGGHIAGWRSEC
eukprot:8373379-Alexandrium_andersonii.AAC.1